MTFLRLFYEFFKTGLFSVGGGMATVPFLQDMSVKTGWFTSGQLESPPKTTGGTSRFPSP